MKQNCLLLLFVIIGLSCKKDELVVASNFDQVKNVQWQFVEFRYTDTIIIGPPSPDSIFLSFDENRKVYGYSRGLCGNYFSSVYYSPNENILRIDPLISTEAACNGSFYWQFIEQFQKTRLYRLDLPFLVLSDSMRNHLIFHAMP